MNREIKFRAWDDKKKEWLLGYDLPNLGGFSLNGECMLLGEWSHVLDQAMHEHIDLKVMQFTGLKDKNGKEIYEGDVVNMHGGSGERGSVCEVYFTNAADFSGFCLKSNMGDGRKRYFQHWTGKDAEIIGNIYENPELLSGSSQTTV